ncbi:putative Transmembrane protein 8A-like [Homarus americanus]|uniref:Putative Transmembrane protein 8A-like n=1 Tax=Homarus americanus TaxID=6706 RepID=A0A8J5MUI9_HOMAM|nr:putative Transmembrane protein 8A-like [Homarus americanus]
MIRPKTILKASLSVIVIVSIADLLLRSYSTRLESDLHRVQVTCCRVFCDNKHTSRQRYDVPKCRSSLEELLRSLPLVGRLLKTTHPQLCPGELDGVWKLPVIHWIRKISEIRRQTLQVSTSCTGPIVPLSVIFLTAVFITVVVVAGLGCGLLVRRLWRRSSSEHEHNNKLKEKYKSVRARLYEPCRRTKLYRMQAQSDSSESSSSEEESSSSSYPDTKQKKRKKEKACSVSLVPEVSQEGLLQPYTTYADVTLFHFHIPDEVTRVTWEFAAFMDDPGCPVREVHV